MTEEYEKIIEKLESNWKIFYDLVGKIKNKNTRNSLVKLCDAEKDRFAAAPASTRLDYTDAYPGGLVRHSLNVYSLANNLNKAFVFNEDQDSILITSLFHDFGKIGNDSEDYYLENNSNWHRDRGIMYEINNSIASVHPANRSVWWLTAKAKCQLKENELYSIMSLSRLDQMYSSDLYNTSNLAVILQSAVRVANIKGKNKTSVLV